MTDAANDQAFNDRRNLLVKLEQLIDDAIALDGTIAAKGDEPRLLSLRVRLITLRSRLISTAIDLLLFRNKKTAAQMREPVTVEAFDEMQKMANAVEQARAPSPPVARNAPCPCGSRKKYKLCCGHDAPPLMQAA